MNVIFLDRDGTVIVDPPDKRVDRVEKIQLMPDAIKALGYLAGHNFGIIFITNQAGIAEGRMTPKEFETIHNKVKEMLKPSGATILQTYVCPHKPEDNCDCRKPKPKLLLQALHDFNLDPKTTYFIGDRQTDMQAGVSAGIKTILIKGADATPETNEAEYAASTLLDAIKYAVDHS